MKTIVIIVSLIVLGFGFRQSGEPTPTPTTTTMVVEQEFFYGAHEALQEDLENQSAFIGG